MRGSVWVPLSVGALLLLVVITLPVAPAGARIDHQQPGSGASSLSVEAVPGYGFQPSLISNEPTNTNITVTFTDDDKLQHAFTITSRQGWVIPIAYTQTQLDEFLSAYPPMYYALVNSGGPPSVGSFLSPSTPGWYEFICNVSGHFQNGMYGFIAFGESLPPNLTTPSRVGVGGLDINPYQAVSIGALVLVTVVALVLWWRSRPPRRSTLAPRRRGPSPAVETRTSKNGPGPRNKPTEGPAGLGRITWSE